MLNQYCALLKFTWLFVRGNVSFQNIYKIAWQTATLMSCPYFAGVHLKKKRLCDVAWQSAEIRTLKDNPHFQANLIDSKRLLFHFTYQKVN